MSRVNARACLVTALMAVIGCASQPATAATDAADVASAFFAQKARSLLARAYWLDNQNKSAVSCVARWDVDEIGQRLVPALHRELTSDELQQARQFLDTPTGQRYAERATHKAPRQPMSSEESADLQAFAKTDAGRKLQNAELLRNMAEALDLASSDQLKECESRFKASSEEKIEVSPSMIERALDELACTPPRPSYPAEAIRNLQRGNVRVRLWINQSGLVYMTLVTKSSKVPMLDAAAERAVQNVRCQPYMHNGKPIIVVGEQPINFEIH